MAPYTCSMWTVAQHLATLTCGLLIGFTIGPTQFVLRDLASNTAACQPLPSIVPQISTSTHSNTGMIVDDSTGGISCGFDWRDAERAGCHFDILASRWYYEECSNTAVMETMLEEVHFDFFEDEEHQIPMSSEVARSGKFDGRIFPFPDFHIMHCLYLWRRLHAAVVEHRHIDDDIYDFGHTVHCTRMIMEWPEWIRDGKNSSTSIRAGTPYCQDRGF